MVYGPPGVGKTMFIDSLADQVFFISTDRGTRYLSARRLEAHNYEQLDAIVKKLESEFKAGTLAYDLVCLDHVNDICLMVEEYTCDQLGIEALGDVGFAKGWKAYKKGIWTILQRLLKINVGVALICHERITTIRTSVMETERTMPDIGKSASKVLVPVCDIVGYCGFKIMREGGKRKQVRTIRTKCLESIYAKDRTGRRKPVDGFELLNGEAFAETFKKGAKKHGKKKKRKVKKG